ncbi:hypothetical protein NliqN6_5734 [Naganishia liquefaciens]|uniref:BRCT domain-containing protein n=1 Tax=Naganishia liquefaciens TaxID=104408 RepID=A0A8H3TY98_9TREE|nr:hypothetical protein NliqN6_5734 [Naganishia liquefaciens]
MPRIVGLGPSPLKSLVRYQQPAIRSDALSGPQVTKGEASTVPVIPFTQTATQARDNSVSGSTVDSKPKFFSPAKVPVGSQTPFRYGTNRILDVPLSAVKKGGRWSLASDLSDDSLLLAASPKKPVDRPKTSHSSMSINPSGKKTEEGRHALNETAKNLELVFLEEDSPDGIPPDSRNVLQPKMPPSTGTLAKYTLEKSRKAVPQKTSAARIVHRAQKSLSLPRTTSSYANPTRSSMNAAAITAASIDARTSLKNAIKEPSRKPFLTPATEISAPSPTVFARPCGIQSRTSTIPPSTHQPVSPKPCSATSNPSQQSPAKSPVKPGSYIPISPIRERNANIPSGVHRSTIQSDAIGLGRPAPVVNNARRKSLTMETSKSLYGLSAALAKLTVKRPSLEGRPPDAESSKPKSRQIKSDDASQQASTQPTKPVAISRIPKSTSMHGRSSLTGLGRGSLDVKAGSLGESVASSLKDTRPIHPGRSETILKGVIAFVDVRTAEGDDTSAVFAEMLRSCGARVLTKPTESCTHIIFKSGKISTLIWWRKQPEPKPHMVGIGWVTKCRDSGERVGETGFNVDVAAQAVFQKRRKSMEPRQLHALMGTSLESIGSATGSSNHPNETPARRMSMHFGQI